MRPQTPIPSQASSNLGSGLNPAGSGDGLRPAAQSVRHGVTPNGRHHSATDRPRFFRLASRLLAALLASSTGAAAAADFATIQRADGGDGGLVVLVEAAQPALAQQLAGTDRHVVVALSADAAKVAEFDEAFVQAKVFPVADAIHWRSPAVLPFQSNAVNVLVLDEATASRLDDAEVQRVLVPGYGVAFVGRNELRKPRPTGMDVWMAYNRDGTGNRNSNDTVLQPPNSIQWMLGPRDVRGTDPHMVTERFHIIHHNWFDDDKFQEVFARTKSDLFVRDAFSGISRWSMPHNLGRHLPWVLIHFTDGKWLYQVRHGHTHTMEIRDLRSGAVVQATLEQVQWAARLGSEGGHMPISLSRRPESFKGRLFTDGTRLYHLDGGSIIRALSMDGREKLWEKTLPDGEYSDMGAIDGDNLAVVLSSTNNFPIGSMRNFLNNTNTAKAIIGLDPASGEQRWRYDGVEGFPLMYLANEHGFVVAAAHLDDPRRAGKGTHSTRPSHEQVAGNFLVSLDAASGREHFRRTDFSDLRNNSLRQNLCVLPDRIVINEESQAYVVDVRSGATIHAQINLGSPRNGWNATTPNWIISNGLFVSHDGSVTDDTATRITWPQYSGASKPANGMYYVASGLETINGSSHVGLMMALSRQELPAPLPEADRLLVRGNAVVGRADAGDWPMLRADPLRSARNPVDGPAALRLAWQAQIAIPTTEGVIAEGRILNSAIPGALTPAVIDTQRVLVASPDDHLLLCFGLADGKERWRLRLGGRVIGPPTLAGGVAYVGVNDGTVSAVDLDRGSVIWTFLAAPYERLLHAHHQLESTHPVFPPLLHEGTLYVNAGRHGYADNGILVWALDPTNGTVKGRQLVTGDHVNDLMQVVANRLRLIGSELDPASLAVSPTDYRLAPSLNPDVGGKVGGAGWIRSFIAWRGYRIFDENGGTGVGLATQLPDGFGAYASDNYREFAFSDRSKHRKQIAVGNVMNMQLAAAGQRQYLAGRETGRNATRAIRLVAIDTASSTVARTEIAAEIGEQVVTDGIAVAHGHVIVTTTAGRVLAFKAP